MLHADYQQQRVWGVTLKESLLICKDHPPNDLNIDLPIYIELAWSKTQYDFHKMTFYLNFI